MSLKAMTVSKLKDLKREVEAAIHSKVMQRRHEIESELSKLSRLDGRANVVRAGAKVALKFSKKPDEPPIANKAKASTPKQPKKTRKARKARKVANSVAAGLSSVATAEHVEALPVEALPVEALPALPVEVLAVEPPPVASMHANVMPTDVSVAA
jgi:hypothetical protein